MDFVTRLLEDKKGGLGLGLRRGLDKKGCGIFKTLINGSADLNHYCGSEYFNAVSL